MATTPKELRAPPERIFDDYILTRIVEPGPGLTRIADNIMTPLSGGSDITYFGSYHIGQGFSDDAASIVTPIGFDFEFDGHVYQHYIANTNGFLILCDPTVQVTTPVSTFHGHVLMSGTSLTYQNQNIRLINTSNSAMLCPWFDDIKTLSDTVDKVSGGTAFKQRVKEGLQPPPLSLDQVAWGVRRYVEDSEFGRRSIVRWGVQSNFASSAVAALRFEIVLYENGNIEYRYNPRKKILSNIGSAEDATIGIFMPGTNNFRDFAPGLGYREGTRVINANGGATYDENPSFVDTVDGTPRPYVGNLNPDVHWPGLSQAGAIFSFQAPKNRRKVLPRLLQKKRGSRIVLPTVARTGDKRSGAQQLRYDDRRSVSYITGTVINYPTTLQPLRGLGNTEPTTIERLDLYPGGLEVTGSIEKAAIEQYLEPVNLEGILDPFDEANRFELGSAALDDAFFVSGSSTTLNQPLRSKTHVRFSLPINLSTLMLGVSSSIYYYNALNKAFNVPLNSVESISSFATTGGDSDIANAGSQAILKHIPEDHRGFGPIGNVIGSGSNQPAANTPGPSVPADLTGTDSYINAPYTPQNAVAAIQRPLDKSISKNPSYEATRDETFSIPINQPFVLEKAVIEVPFELGDSWFRDKTSTYCPHLTGERRPASFDFGGPGITVALFNQLQVGPRTRRDLILTGTITHTFDDVSEVNIARPTGVSTETQVRNVGFRSFGTPSAVVTPKGSSSGGYFFTGSVAVKTEALISNGVMVSFIKEMNNVAQPTENRLEVRRLLGLETLKLVSASVEYGHGYNIAYINPLGRGQTGFDPSGRSITGKEYSTSQTVIEKGVVSNPLYTPTLSTQQESAISTFTTFLATTLLNLEAAERSPYLLLPGDKLVLSIAKSRPYYFTNQASIEPFSGSYHDVKITSGSVNVTLYGTLLRNEEEVSFGLNQNLASDAVHEVVGAEPVLDQFEVYYRDELIGGASDDYVTGSILSVNVGSDGIKIITTGSRGRVFSSFDARLQPPPDESAAEVATNPSKAFRLQPWYERVGIPRYVELFDNEERYWDSMMPSIKDVFTADGTGIWIPVFSAFGTTAKVSQANVGYMLFDYQRPAFSTRIKRLINGNWSWAFPFEPRYAQASRQKFAQKGFVATEIYDDIFEPNTIPPREIDGFIFGPATFLRPGEDPWIDGTSPFAPNEVRYRFVSDAFLGQTNPSGFFPTSSAGLDDALRALYGFGDLNTYREATIGGQTFKMGARHWANYLDEDRSGGSSSGKNHYIFKPVIRGWKYGVHSGIPAFSKMHFRRSNFGQFRDMLEQRPFARYFKFPERGTRRRQGLAQGPVEVKFVDSQGNLTNPSNTSSQNLSQAATSSIPYFDDLTRNREPLNQATQNKNIISFGSDEFNNVDLG